MSFTQIQQILTLPHELSHICFFLCLHTHNFFLNHLRVVWIYDVPLLNSLECFLRTRVFSYITTVHLISSRKFNIHRILVLQATFPNLPIILVMTFAAFSSSSLESGLGSYVTCTCHGPQVSFNLQQFLSFSWSFMTLMFLLFLMIIFLKNVGWLFYGMFLNQGLSDVPSQ